MRAPRNDAITHIVGHFLREAGIGPTPIVLALVLGNMMESNFRRAMLQSGGDPAVFLSSPIAAVCLVLAALMLVVPTVQDARRGRKTRQTAPHAAGR